jgi:hypothetical protein
MISKNDSFQGQPIKATQKTPIVQLAKTLKIGDLVFIRITVKPFREVANATGTWTNHVGIVTNIDGAEPLIGESTFPFSRTTTLSKFVRKSEHGIVAVSRLKFDLSSEQIHLVQKAVHQRTGIFYDTGFNLHSNKEFCSRYVHEVIKESTGVTVGKIESFKELLASRPNANLRFWKYWYFGQIPWERQTITPASLLNSTEVNSVFNGNIQISKK